MELRLLSLNIPTERGRGNDIIIIIIRDGGGSSGVGRLTTYTGCERLRPQVGPMPFP